MRIWWHLLFLDINCSLFYEAIKSFTFKQWKWSSVPAIREQTDLTTFSPFGNTVLSLNGAVETSYLTLMSFFFFFLLMGSEWGTLSSSWRGSSFSHSFMSSSLRLSSEVKKYRKQCKWCITRSISRIIKYQINLTVLRGHHFIRLFNQCGCETAFKANNES